MSAVEELNISVPTEVQCRGIPAILKGQSIGLASHTGSGKKLECNHVKGLKKMSALRMMMLFQSSFALLNTTSRASVIPCRIPTCRVYVGFKIVTCASYSSSSAATLADNSKEEADGDGNTQQARAISLLDKLRSRHLKDFQLQNDKSKSKSNTSATSKKGKHKGSHSLSFIL